MPITTTAARPCDAISGSLELNTSGRNRIAGKTTGTWGRTQTRRFFTAPRLKTTSVRERLSDRPSGHSKFDAWRPKRVFRRPKSLGSFQAERIQALAPPLEFGLHSFPCGN